MSTFVQVNMADVRVGDLTTFGARVTKIEVDRPHVVITLDTGRVWRTSVHFVTHVQRQGAWKWDPVSEKLVPVTTSGLWA